MANVSENATKTTEKTAWLHDSNASVDDNDDNYKSPTNSNHGNTHLIPICSNADCGELINQQFNHEQSRRK